MLISNVTQRVSKKIFQKKQSFQQHEPCSFCYVLTDNDNNIIKYKIYKGKKAGYKFLLEMIDLFRQIIIKLNSIKPIELDENDLDHHERTEICCICDKKFHYDVKVYDHDHFSGKYRG